MKKSLCLSAAVAIVGTSHASFELALVAQTHTSPNGPATRKIGRWDPQNGLFLGYFGAGNVTGTALAIDPTQSDTVLDIFGGGNVINLQRFNYSTGENLGLTTISLGGSNTVLDAQALSGGQFLLAGTIGGINFARLLTSAGSTVRTYANPAGTTSVLSAFQNSAGVTFVLSKQNGSVSGDKYSLSSYAANSGTIATTVVVADNTTSVFENIIQSGNSIIVGGALVSSRKIMTISGTTLGASGGAAGYGIVSDTYFAGHGNAYYAMGYESVNNRVYIHSLINSGVGTYTYFDSPQYGTIYDSAIVVAPEPMTMVGFGLGIPALVRRRKNANVTA